MNSTRIAGNVSLNDGFRALGAVQLENASIGGEIDCTDGTFERGSEGAN